MRFAEDLLDEEDEPTVMETPPQVSEVADHELDTIIRKPGDKAKRKMTLPMRGNKK